MRRLISSLISIVIAVATLQAQRVPSAAPQRLQRAQEVCPSRNAPGFCRPDYATKVIADGAIAHWHLNDPISSTTVAETTGTWPLTVHGTVTFQQAGPSNAAQGVLVDGTVNGTTMDTASAFNYAFGTGGFSAEIWFKTTYNTTQDGVMDDKDAGSGSAGFNLAFFNGNPFCRFANGTVQSAVQSSNTYLDGNWHYFVCTLTRGGTDTITIYIDGALDSSGPTSAPGWNITNSSLKLRIGSYSTSITSPFIFRGTLSEAALYPVTLTAAQILDHYRIGSR